MPISAVIITLNEAANLGRCLKSLQGVADEVVVVDSGSTDGTKDTAEKFGARFFFTEWRGYAATKNWGHSKAIYPYILSIDADEELSEELRQAILAKKENLHGAYLFSRLTRMGDRWIKYGGWYPDKRVRLFANGQGRWVGDFVHEKLQLATSTPIKQLHGDLLHHSYESISAYWQRMDRYTTLAANEMHQQGKRNSWLKLWLKPHWTFFRIFWLKQGFRDGLAGWTIAHFSAAYQRAKYLKLAELERKLTMTPKNNSGEKA